MLKTILFPTLGALALISACDQIRTPGSTSPENSAQTEPEQPEPAAPTSAPEVVQRPRVTTKRAAIDWDSARADYARRETSPDDDAFSVAGASNAAVPILLPSTPITTAAVGDGPAMQFRPLEDGYYAVYPGTVYDMIINGTDRLAAAPGRETVVTDSELRFEDTMMGSQVAFSRYGASYLVEFACKDPDAANGDGCITEAEAKAMVQELLIAGTQ